MQELLKLYDESNVVLAPDGNTLYVVRDSESNEILFEITEEGEEKIVAEGGMGGRGNWHFKNSVNAESLSCTLYKLCLVQIFINLFQSFIQSYEKDHQKTNKCCQE